jgi:hypothetical protein
MTGTFVQVAFTGRKNTLIVCLADVTLSTILVHVLCMCKLQV